MSESVIFGDVNIINNEPSCIINNNEKQQSMEPDEKKYPTHKSGKL